MGVVKAHLQAAKKSLSRFITKKMLLIHPLAMSARLARI
ncbi:MAG: hypothetical protein ACI9DC_004238 [Gammaproteobacteria bacterium]|jgi:hypothetical protein